MEIIKILSIDIGISNLGYVWGNMHFNSDEYTTDFNYYKKMSYLLHKDIFVNNIEILDCNRVNITHIKHNKVKFCDCNLRHESCIPDYLDHFIQEYNDMFEHADIILLERQPPQGIMNVQDLLFTRFREKVILISPNSIHKYFNMSKDYDTRKQESENISTLFLNTFRTFNNNIRKHDISDSLLMVIWYYHNRFEQFSKKISNGKGIDLEAFRYHPPG